MRVKSKNIHVLPTEKPSRLFEILNFNYIFDSQNKYSDEYKKLHKWRAKHIYITSDEEIKEGNWCLNEGDFDKHLIFKADSFFFDTGLEAKKIILTTDQDLIKDGAQAIDDEFLEWFVKNPSCEEVMLWRFHGINTSIAEVNAISGDGSLNWQGKSDLRDYKIIIPKEEPKQEFPKQNIIDNWLEKNGDPEIDKQVEQEAKELCEQETLEEAAREYYKRGQLGFEKAADTERAFLRGGFWQQEKTCNHSYILTAEQGHRVIKCSKCNDTQPI